MLDAGDRAPEFSLPDQSGKKKTFSDLTGKKGLVLYLYPKDDTPGCTVEAVDFTTSLTKFRRKGFNVVGVSKDSVESHCKFIDKHGLKVSLISDPKLELIKALGAWVEKKNYGKTYMGIQRSTFVFDAGGTALRVYPKVRAKGHVEQVLGEVAGLKAPVRYWLLKSEPGTYAWSDLVKEKRDAWDGVRNYQARNNLRQMKKGDLCFFYHSVKERNVVGVCEVVSAPYADPTGEGDTWTAVDVKAKFPLKEPVNLAQIKGDKALKKMVIANNTRLSVSPVTEAEFERVVALGGKGRLR